MWGLCGRCCGLTIGILFNPRETKRRKGPWIKGYGIFSEVRRSILDQEVQREASYTKHSFLPHYLDSSMKVYLVICSAKDNGIKVKYLSAWSLLILSGSPLLAGVVGYHSLGNKLFFWMLLLPRLTSFKRRETQGDSLTSAFQHRGKWYVIYSMCLFFKYRLTQLLRVLIMQWVIGSLEWKVEMLNQNHKQTFCKMPESAFALVLCSVTAVGWGSFVSFLAPLRYCFNV